MIATTRVAPAVLGGAVRRALLRALSSRPAAMCVMGAAALALGLATFLPSVDLAANPQALADRPIARFLVEHLALQRLVEGPAFLAAIVYLGAAIGLSIVHRLRTFVRRGAAAGPAGRFRVERRFVVDAPVDAARDRIAGALRRAGYRIVDTAAPTIEGSRGTAGFFGSIAFHASLLVVLAGAATSAMTRTSGEILLAEGFPAPLVHSSFHSIQHPERLPQWPERSLTIRDFSADYSRTGTNVDFALVLSLLRGGAVERESVVRVNHGMAVDGLDLALHRYGFAPEIGAHEEGRERLGAVGALQLIPPGREDALPLEGGGELRVRLYPDFTLRGGTPASRSPVPRDPVIEFDWVESAGDIVASGRVRLGEEVKVAGRTVRFESLNYWASFLGTRDDGMWLLLLGSLLGTAGLILRFACPDRSVRVHLAPRAEGTSATLVAATRCFPALHEESIDELVPGLGTTA